MTEETNKLFRVFENLLGCAWITDQRETVGDKTLKAAWEKSNAARAALVARIEELEGSQKALLQRAIDAEMELLALKSPISPELKAKMDRDRKQAEKGAPEWLNQAFNEGDGTYKP